jgi:hypothetical protein
MHPEKEAARVAQANAELKEVSRDKASTFVDMSGGKGKGKGPPPTGGAAAGSPLRASHKSNATGKPRMRPVPRSGRGVGTLSTAMLVSQTRHPDRK